MKADELLNERKRMVSEQIAARGVKDRRVLSAMECIPRHLFISPDDIPWAYSDAPLPIGHGQTISQPYMVALMTELLELEGGERLLEVGTGSGYQAAVLGEIAAEVHTLELIPELAEVAGQRLAGMGYLNVFVHAGDGSLGWPAAAPYQGILVAAAAPCAPQPLLDQLSDGGRLVVPVGNHGFQKLEVWVKEGRAFRHTDNLSVAFVPLRGEHGWKI
jgi:protein-L-isoaspartate(D-aspartate) O-methyltransferase